MTRPPSPLTAQQLQRLVAVVNGHGRGAGLLPLQEAGLTFPQLIVLQAIQAEGALPVSALAERTRLSLGATSQLVERLVDGELVSRVEHPEDRRVRLVSLRPRGRLLVGKLNGVRKQDVDELLARLPDDLQTRLGKILTEVLTALGPDDEP